MIYFIVFHKFGDNIINSGIAKRITTFLPLFSNFHHSRIGEHFKMLRHGRLSKSYWLDNISNLQFSSFLLRQYARI